MRGKYCEQQGLSGPWDGADRNGRRATETETKIGRDPRGADPSERLENDLLERKRNGGVYMITAK